MKLDRLVLGAEGRKVELIVRQGTSDTSLVGQIFVDGAFDLRRLRRIDELRGFLARVRALGKRPLIVDAGANIGLTSVYFSLQCLDATIVAIEPEPGNFAVLQYNAKARAVAPLPCALSCEAKCLELFDPGQGEWGFQTRPSNSVSTGFKVDCVSVNEIYNAYAGQTIPFIVKIDIEGGESDVFSKNLSWIDETPLIIVELHDWLLPKKSTSKSFLRAIAGRDRDFIYFGENIFSISNDLRAHLSHHSAHKS